MPIPSQIMQVPLTYGDGKNSLTMDFRTLMPENMIVVMRPTKGADGYMRVFPGIDKVSDVNGVSRGVQWNTQKDYPYRVMGTKLYGGDSEVGDVPGSGRAPMAHSRTSQAVVANGLLQLYPYAGGRKTFSNWDDTNYNLGVVHDVCHLRQRYIFSQENTDTFWCSDLDDESKPDKIAPAYRAESMPDGILAIRAWRDYVLCFGSASIEFFALTGNDQQIYQSQPSYTVDAGTVGRDAVCEYMNSFAFITGPSCGIITIALMNASGGSWSDIASNEVKKILESYSLQDLKVAFLERLAYHSHNLLIVHLPRHTLVYDSAASTALGFQVWTILKTGLGDGIFSGVDFMRDGTAITCGDLFASVKGKLTEEKSSQYSAQQEFILYTPMIPAENAIIADLEIDANGGHNSKANTIFISASEDGIRYGKEIAIRYTTPQHWLNRTLLRKVCRVRTAVSFKLRVVGADPVTLSRLRVRIC